MFLMVANWVLLIMAVQLVEYYFDGKDEKKVVLKAG